MICLNFVDATKENQTDVIISFKTKLPPDDCPVGSLAGQVLVMPSHSHRHAAPAR